MMYVCPRISSQVLTDNHQPAATDWKPQLCCHANLAYWSFWVVIRHFVKVLSYWLAQPLGRPQHKRLGNTPTAPIENYFRPS